MVMGQEKPGRARRGTTVAGAIQPALDELGTGLQDTTFCVIDLETTGTGPGSRITEIGAVKVRGGEVLGEFQTLVNPEVAIPGFITGLTGITNAAVRTAPRLAEVFPSLVEFCRGAVMVAHNAGFDMGFILRAAAELGYDWPAPTVVDTVWLARRVIPRHEVRNYRLGTLAAFLATPAQPSHRALDDARATVDVLHELLGRVGNQAVTTVDDLLQFSYTVSKARRTKRTWATDLPEGPGVYFFVRDTKHGRRVLYVGTSKHLRRRVSTYFTPAESRQRMEEMIGLATGVETVECHTALEAAVVELRLITAHQPPYNRRSLRPHHTFLTLTDEPVPRLSLVRRVKRGPEAYAGPFSGRTGAELAALALTEAFPLRPCTQRLRATGGGEPCALAEMGSCLAPCTGAHLAEYARLVGQVRECLAGDIRLVHQACFSAIDLLSAEERYEEAAELLVRYRSFAAGMRRKARVVSVAGCPSIVAARRLGEAWEVHVIAYGSLAAAGVARPGDDPVALAETLQSTTHRTPPAVPGWPAGSIEEAELIAAWLEEPGVRLLDIDGTWGWPVHAQRATTPGG